MDFTEPKWFFLLIVVPIVVTTGILMWLHRSKRWKRLVADRLKRRLSHPRSGVFYFLSLGLAMLGLTLMVTALAMPERGEEWVDARSEGRNILLCFDISQSMLTQDVGAGSRLDAAKGAALEIIERFPSDRIGLLIFSGETQIAAPLTIDHTFLNQTVTQLNPLDLPIGGSNLALALKDSTKLLAETGQRNNVMVVLSDGEDHSSGIEGAARKASSEGVFIYALGFGSEKGDFIRDPRERDGFFKDRRRNRVISQLKEESLQQIADQTGGLYSRGAGGDFLRNLDAAVSKMDRFEQEGGHQRIAKPVYQWFLLPSLLLLMSSTIISRLPVAKAAVVLAVGFLSLGEPAQGNELWDTLVGQSASRSGEHAKASEHFHEAAEQAKGDRRARLHLASGAAAYQARDWDSAISSFSEALLSEDQDICQQAHYALANALYYQGASNAENRSESWKGAISHYEEALKLKDDQATRDNMAAVKKLLEQQQQQEPENQEKDEEQEKSDQENKDEEQQDQSDEDPSQSSENENQQEEQESQDSNQENENQGDSNQENEGDPSEQEQEQNGNSDQGDNPKEQQGNPSENEDPQDNKNQNQETEANNGKEPSEETSKEQARRILREQADFGGNPPRAQRRVLRRPEKDW